MRVTQAFLTTELQAELLPLLEKHYAEFKDSDEKLDFDFDFEQLYILQQVGALRIYGARDAKKLIGYAIYIIGGALTNKGHKIGMCQMFFLEKAYRKGMNGYNLLKTSVEILDEEETCSKIMIGGGISRDIGPLCERLKMKHTEKVYTRF
jgi:hypothetical protein